MALLEERGVPSVWRESIAGHLSQIDDIQQRIRPIDSELAPIARSDPRAQLLQTIPGVGRLIGLTLASEIGDVARFSSASKLVGYAGLAPRISRSGERSATGRLSKAGSRTLRWAAVEAANQAWRPTNPFHEHYRRLAARHGTNPAKSSVARKLLIATWHMLSRGQVFQPHRSMTAAEAPHAFWPPDGPAWNRDSAAAPRNDLRPSAEREMSSTQCTGSEGGW
jgi:transposase